MGAHIFALGTKYWRTCEVSEEMAKQQICKSEMIELVNR